MIHSSLGVLSGGTTDHAWASDGLLVLTSFARSLPYLGGSAGACRARRLRPRRPLGSSSSGRIRHHVVGSCRSGHGTPGKLPFQVDDRRETA